MAPVPHLILIRTGQNGWLAFVSVGIKDIDAKHIMSSEVADADIHAGSSLDLLATDEFHVTAISDQLLRSFPHFIILTYRTFRRAAWKCWNPEYRLLVRECNRAPIK